MSRAAYLAKLERQRLLGAERRARARAEAQGVAEGVAETVALSIARGSEFETPADARRARPYRRQPGLDWLVAKGRLSPAQRAAGERYGACYRRARGEISIASTLDVKPGLSDGVGTPLSTVLAQAEASVQARARLAAYRRRLWDQAALVAACDQICGEELTPREAAAAEREASRLEAVLAVALDILAGV